MRWLVVLFALLLALPAGAQDYPTRPVKIVVSYPAGGSNDVVARTYAAELQKELGQSFIVENRAGASGTIGADMVAKSPADGYTLFMGAGAHTLAPSLYKKMSYDIVEDFAPISLAAVGTYVLVLHPTVPASTLPELIALLKAKPGQLNYASAGKGTPLHLAAELFKSKTGTDIVHVPYGGDSPALNDLTAGTVQLSFMSVAPTVPLIRAGKLRALGVTSARRSDALPDLPTLSELGIADYDIGTWWGLLAPAGTPDAIVARLNAGMRKAAALPQVRERFAPLGLEPKADSSAAFAAFIKSEVDRYAAIARIAGIEPE